MATSKINYRTFYILVLAVLFLYVAQAFIIPLIYGGFIAIFLYPLCSRLENFGFNRAIAILTGMLFVSIVLAILSGLVYYQYRLFSAELPLIIAKLKPKLEPLLSRLGVITGLQPDLDGTYVQSFLKYSGQDIGGLLKSGINGSITLFFNIIIIPIYAALFLNYRTRLVAFLAAVAGPQNQAHVEQVVVKTVRSYTSYIKGMALVYLIVGILNSAGLLLLGVKYAVLFGMITAVMTIIPYLGIIISSLLPISMSLLTSDSIYYPLGVVFVFSIVQYLEGNFIYPYIVGKRMNVNMLVSLISVVAGGYFWGVSGMVLVLPLVGILKIVADETENLKALSLLMGDKPITKNP